MWRSKIMRRRASGNCTPPGIFGLSFLSISVLALLVVSLLFGAIHLHGPSLVPLTVLSLGMCAGYLRTGHMLTPIVMHATLNALNLLALSARA